MTSGHFFFFSAFGSKKELLESLFSLSSYLSSAINVVDLGYIVV